MSTRKYLRARVRHMAESTGLKPSAMVHRWRYFLDAYPKFHGEKRQKKGSKQPILKYPVPKEFKTEKPKVNRITHKDAAWDKLRREAVARRRAETEGRA